MDDTSCQHFEAGLRQSFDNNSWNANDNSGLLLCILIVVTLVAFITASTCAVAKTIDNRVGIGFGTLTICTVVWIVYMVQSNVMCPLYMVSQLLTRTERTPAIYSLPELRKVFPGSVEFEHAYDQLLVEIQALDMAQIPLTRDTYAGTNEHIGSDGKDAGNHTLADGWRVMSVSVGDEENPMAVDKLPTLIGLVRKHSNLVKSCVVSILPAGTFIPQHVGYYKGVLRYMLAIEVPPGPEVYLCVNDQKLTWKGGESVMFDDNFPHKVYNKSESRRIVVYMDIERPMSGWKAKMNKYIIRTAQKSDVVTAELRKTEQLKTLGVY
jgi:hypothetical protein